MGSVELDNANPTILSVSELPTHRQRRKARGDGSNKQGIQELLMAKPSYAMDPFYLSDFSDTDSDDSSVEPIDEQEIYGEFSHLRNFLRASKPSMHNGTRVMAGPTLYYLTVFRAMFSSPHLFLCSTSFVSATLFEGTSDDFLSNFMIPDD